jgi:NTP pyrophosphatase (non-canonical NTP hydrolase)
VTSTKRYFVERGPEQIKTAFGAALKICDREGIDKITLLVPRKGGWDGTLVADFLGKSITKALLKGEAVPLGSEGPRMQLESPQTFRISTPHQMIMGAHVSTADMEKADNSRSARVIFYLPWGEQEAQEWLDTWEPEIVGEAKQAATKLTLPDAVEDALKNLTQHINLSTGLGHPSDKAHAVRAIEHLISDRQTVDPLSVRRWALRHGWSSSAASELEIIVQRACG